MCVHWCDPECVKMTACYLVLSILGLFLAHFTADQLNAYSFILVMIGCVYLYISWNCLSISSDLKEHVQVMLTVQCFVQTAAQIHSL